MVPANPRIYTKGHSFEHQPAENHQNLKRTISRSTGNIHLLGGKCTDECPGLDKLWFTNISTAFSATQLPPQHQNIPHDHSPVDTVSHSINDDKSSQAKCVCVISPTNSEKSERKLHNLQLPGNDGDLGRTVQRKHVQVILHYDKYCVYLNSKS